MDYSMYVPYQHVIHTIHTSSSKRVLDDYEQLQDKDLPNLYHIVANNYFYDAEINQV